jgi:hypothetical protein
MSRRQTGSKDPSKKELDRQVMGKLIDTGIFNQLHARLLSRVAAVVQTSPFDAMKPYRDPPTDTDHIIAASLVSAFLSTYSLTETISSIRSESPAVLPRTPDIDLAVNALNLPSRAEPLTALVRDWDPRITDDNRRETLAAVEERLQTLAGDVPPERPARVSRPAPAPKATPVPVGKSTARAWLKKQEKSDEFGEFDSDNDPPPLTTRAAKSTPVVRSTKPVVKSPAPPKETLTNDNFDDSLDGDD